MAVVAQKRAPGLTRPVPLGIVAALMPFSHTRADFIRGVMLAAAGLVLLLGAAGCGERAPTSPSATPPAGIPSDGASAVPAQTPAFSFTTFDGESHTSENLKGRPVILNFWADYCPACAEFSPRLEEVYQKHKDEGLLVFGIGADGSEEALRKKADALGITYELATSTETIEAFAVHAIPMTFLIGADGETKSAILGARQSEQLAAEVEKIL
ncbi:MAG: TlpA family protein disulfide reductase [Armatimonadetes bacterium]|nr:TlpA family protein disulfide reductase [Armatimonadota bacterium]